MPRLMACYTCHTLVRLDDYEGPPEYDAALEDACQRHDHGGAGTGMLFSTDAETAKHIDYENEVKVELLKNHQVMYDTRDELREDAGKCFLKHHQPSWPDSPCIDWQGKGKKIGRTPPDPKWQQYLCDYCAYRSSVTVAIRHARGDYD